MPILNGSHRCCCRFDVWQERFPSRSQNRASGQDCSDFNWRAVARPTIPPPITTTSYCMVHAKYENIFTQRRRGNATQSLNENFFSAPLRERLRLDRPHPYIQILFDHHQMISWNECPFGTVGQFFGDHQHRVIIVFRCLQPALAIFDQHTARLPE